MGRVSQQVTLTYRESRNGKVAIITLNRPEKYNALSGAHYRRLARLMARVNADDGVVATLWRSTGKFFSAGADVRAASSSPATATEADDEDDEDGDDEGFYMRQFTGGNLNITHEFFHHRHPLFVSLNGPVIGMTAALVAYGDFIYATEDAYLLTPFASLGLAPEGGSSVMFPLKMGAGLANRALILSERLTSQELARAGFIGELFARGDDLDERVFRHIEAVMTDKNVESMRIAKEHIRDGLRERLESANVKEVYGAIERFNAGIPQEQFMRLATKEKKHKL